MNKARVEKDLEVGDWCVILPSHPCGHRSITFPTYKLAVVWADRYMRFVWR